MKTRNSAQWGRTRPVYERLDALHRTFTMLDKLGTKTGDDLAADWMIGFGLGEPEHYERLYPELLEEMRSGLLRPALWQRVHRYFHGSPAHPLSIEDPLGAIEAATWITSFFPEEPLPREGPDVLRQHVHHWNHHYHERARVRVALLGDFEGTLMRTRFQSYYDAWLDRDRRNNDQTDWAKFHRLMRAERDSRDSHP